MIFRTRITRDTREIAGLRRSGAARPRYCSWQWPPGPMKACGPSTIFPPRQCKPELQCRYHQGWLDRVRKAPRCACPPAARSASPSGGVENRGSGADQSSICCVRDCVKVRSSTAQVELHRGRLHERRGGRMKNSAPGMGREILTRIFRRLFDGISTAPALPWWTGIRPRQVPAKIAAAGGEGYAGLR